MPSEVSTASADQDLGRMVEELKRELSEANRRETATAGVLRVISSSPTDVQPVFDTIVSSAVRLCDGLYSALLQFDGEMLHWVAQHNFTPEALEAAHRVFPARPTRGLPAGRAILERAVLHIPDIELDPEYQHPDLARAIGFRSGLFVPMLREGAPIGVVVVTRAEAGPFSDNAIELLKTFAAQAVIAIENTRLFEEVQARTLELTESLEQQTATSKVLQVISSSPGELGPVFDAMLANATRICEAKFGVLYRYDGKAFHVGALLGVPPALAEELRRGPRHPTPDSGIGRLVKTKQMVHITDIRAEWDPLRRASATADLGGARTFVAVPMLKEGELIGAFVIYRQEVRPFTDKQIALVTSFASQAVIAIENTRLFEEVQARNRDLTALGEVGRAVSSTLDLKVVLKTIVDRAVELSGTDAGSIFYYREEAGAFELGETTGLDDEIVARFRKLDISTGQTGLGEAIANRQPLQVPDILKRASNPLRDAALEAGLRAALIVPLLGGEKPLGALVLQRRHPGEFTKAVVNLVQTFADQSAIALENAHLFEQIAQKSRELELASRHKSQFVANMSHELRTPLAAILGYAELLKEGIYGALPDKSTPIVGRIQSNGTHLLGLINTVLDLSKIEAGQFSLNMAEYALDSMVENVRVATESLAEGKKLALKTDVIRGLPHGLGDEQRLTQVLLNLVGNAIKFTDVGEVRITASVEDGRFTVGVTDTGPGIPAEEQQKIFQEFHQVDNSNTKRKGGTGLGLAIAKQIVEMHGGRIWVESSLGRGSTFRMELPVRAAAAEGAA